MKRPLLTVAVAFTLLCTVQAASAANSDRLLTSVQELPPLPAPSSVRGLRFIAQFDVDSTGRVIAFDFTHTRDGDYNKRIAEVLRAMRFRPGTRPDGSPLRMKAQVGYEF